MQNKKYIIIGIIITIIAIIGVVLWIIDNRMGKGTDLIPEVNAPNLEEAGKITDSSASGAQIFEVSYTDKGFSPSTITIKMGSTVVFKNNSLKDFWPASAVHPTHKEYPTTGGCVGSTFDACKAYKPGESWSFKFDAINVNGWKYHNHLNPTQSGIVIVTK
ncbi:MAG TPA: hypothetical protein PK367_01810 [Candidatus Paceibacterota bacterium]|nr:hypothetical protein [Candidatus Paceibacterota bacterium]